MHSYIYNNNNKLYTYVLAYITYTHTHTRTYMYVHAQHVHIIIQTVFSLTCVILCVYTSFIACYACYVYMCNNVLVLAIVDIYDVSYDVCV